jgi:hypothetical protein
MLKSYSNFLLFLHQFLQCKLVSFSVPGVLGPSESFFELRVRMEKPAEIKPENLIRVMPAQGRR